MILWKLDDVMRRKKAKGREMARRMGIGENYLSRVRHEVPERLSLTLLDALCHELDCTIADLLEYKPGPMPAPEPPLPQKPPQSAKKPPAAKKLAADKKPTPPVERTVPVAEAAPEPVVSAPATPETPPAPAAPVGLSLAQQRAREAIRQGLAPEAAPAEETPASASEEEAKTGVTVVRTSALSSKLDKLRRKGLL